MNSNYYTIKKSCQHEILIQRSRFICHLKRTDNEQEAQEFINLIRSQHKSANHNCFAYVIGENNAIQKASDDGEPSGTAGVPMLEVLKKQELRNVTAVVTRYFGGIKLGGGGLIRAYGSSVSEGLGAAGIVERVRHVLYTVSVDYTLLGKLENELRQNVYQLHEIRYTDKVELLVYVNEKSTEEFEEWITSLTNANAEITRGAISFLELDN